jgi:hypothetical protein
VSRFRLETKCRVALPRCGSDRVGAARDLSAPVDPSLIYSCGDVRALSVLLTYLCRERERLRELGQLARNRMRSWTPQDTVAGTVTAVAVAAALRRRQN